MKYVIIEHYNSSGDPCVSAYKYNWHFRLFGPSEYGYIERAHREYDKNLGDAAIRCKEELNKRINRSDKYKVLEIIDTNGPDTVFSK